MKVTIHATIDTENDAFKGDGGYIADKVAEITRILSKESVPRVITASFITGYDTVTLQDTNGNTVGTMTVETR